MVTSLIPKACVQIHTQILGLVKSVTLGGRQLTYIFGMLFITLCYAIIQYFPVSRTYDSDFHSILETLHTHNTKML